MPDWNSVAIRNYMESRRFVSNNVGSSGMDEGSKKLACKSDHKGTLATAGRLKSRC